MPPHIPKPPQTLSARSIPQHTSDTQLSRAPHRVLIVMSVAANPEQVRASPIGHPLPCLSERRDVSARFIFSFFIFRTRPVPRPKFDKSSAICYTYRRMIHIQ